MMGISLGGLERNTVAMTERPACELRCVGNESNHERSDKTQKRATDRSQQFEELAHRLCKTLANRNTRLSFFLHSSSERVGVRVIDSSTREVLREIPPEQHLELAAKIKDMVGIILDQKM